MADVLTEPSHGQGGLSKKQSGNSAIFEKTLWLVSIAALLSSCGSGGSAVPVVTEPGIGGNPPGGGYSTSQPLVDNSAAPAYKILLMGNSHAAGLQSTLRDILEFGQPGKTIDVRVAPNQAFLVDRVGDGSSEQMLEGSQWTHVILQAQKYSSSGSRTYPTTAAEYWVRGVKEQGATSIMFPEHPRRGNTWEAQTLWELHTGIAARENTCVAPVGYIWDEVQFRAPSLILHQGDGNHASADGLLLSALIFYEIISGESVHDLPALTAFNVDAATEQIYKDVVSSFLFTYQACYYDS